jgi:CYTH domain-containing protein
MIEIERKFLVKDDSFIHQAYQVHHIEQGYLCADRERTVRIRIRENEGFITVKSGSDAKGRSRYEFERLIPLEDAREMMNLCLPGRIDKMRHYVKVGEHTWDVDVFHGIFEGLIIAEIELQSESETFDRPSWLGAEVTGNPKYYNACLISSRT